MKYLDEFRDTTLVQRLVLEIKNKTKGSWNIMEVCGGQTHAILKNGIDQLLPDNIKLLHGPGCPVCVTPQVFIDKAILLAKMPNTIFCTFADMLRVPGQLGDLSMAKAEGADIRMVYSPLDAVTIAQENQKKEVIFFAVGFETTAPANALSVYSAHSQGIENYSMLVSQVLVPPAIIALMADEQTKIDAFMAAGHVCTIMGEKEYLPLASQYKIPIVIAGFEPIDILQAISSTVDQLERGEYRVENQYARSVRSEGNLHAQKILNEIFELADKEWRGLGYIKNSGMVIKDAYRRFDAEKKYTVDQPSPDVENDCLSGEIMKGKLTPKDCPYFSTSCTPSSPRGATMVSSEGACHAYYLYSQ